MISPQKQSRLEIKCCSDQNIAFWSRCFGKSVVKVDLFSEAVGQKSIFLSLQQSENPRKCTPIIVLTKFYCKRSAFLDEFDSKLSRVGLLARVYCSAVNLILK